MPNPACVAYEAYRAAMSSNLPAGADNRSPSNYYR